MKCVTLFLVGWLVCLDSALHKDFNFFPPCFGALIICR